MPSFDIVSEVTLHEVTNAVDQTNRELENRFDFRGVEAKVEVDGDEAIVIRAEADFQVQQVRDILENKWIKRGLDIRSLDAQDPEINLSQARQRLLLKQGLASDFAKKLIKQIKDSKIKVQASIQGDKVRVTGKKRDDLQEVIALLKQADLEQPLQFENFRD